MAGSNPIDVHFKVSTDASDFGGMQDGIAKTKQGVAQTSAEAANLNEALKKASAECLEGFGKLLGTMHELAESSVMKEFADSAMVKNFTASLGTAGAAMKNLLDPDTTKIAKIGFDLAEGLQKISAIGKPLGDGLGKDLADGVGGKMKGFDWKSVGVPMGASIALAVGSAIITAVRDAELQAIEEKDAKLVAARGDSDKLVRRALTVRTAEQGKEVAADAQKDLDRARAEVARLEMEKAAVEARNDAKRENAKTARGRAPNLGLETFDDSTLKIARQRVKSDETAVAKAEGAARQKEAEDEQKRKVQELLAFTKAAQEAAATRKREQLLAATEKGNSDDKLKALDKVIQYVKTEYEEKRKVAAGIADEVKKKEVLAVLSSAEQADVKEFTDRQSKVLADRRREEFTFALQKADAGKVQQMLDDRTTERARVLVDTKLDQEGRENRILEIDTEIADIQAKQVTNAKKIADDAKRAADETVRRHEEEVKGLKTQFDDRQKGQADALSGTLSGIHGDRSLTDREKKAKVYNRLVQERATVDDQIATAHTNAQQAGDTEKGAEFKREAKSLDDRKQGLSNQIEANRPLTLVEQMQEKVVALKNSFTSVADVFGNTMKASIDSISGSMSGLIMGTMTWGNALRNIGTSIIGTIVNGFSKMFAEWIAKRLLMSGVAQSASIKEGATDAVAKAPGTLMTSISSFGVAAAVGLAAYLAAMAAFDMGGYTAKGHKDKPAGIVHAGEWVAPKWMVDSHEFGGVIATLEAGRQGAGGYGIGGFVKDSLIFGGIPKWAFPKAVSKAITDYNLLGGKKIYPWAYQNQEDEAGTASMVSFSGNVTTWSR